jgi:DNA-binding FrmR family transcriptional regulator
MSVADIQADTEPRTPKPKSRRAREGAGVARGYASGKANYLVRLRKIEGQLRGLQRMVESDAYCPDVVIQIASATRALQEVSVGLLNDHLHHCVVAAMSRSETEGNESLDEVTRTIRQVIRL